MSVLDASALLALLFAEDGAEAVAQHLPEASMSTVNLSEVLARFARDGHAPSAVTQKLVEAGIEFVAFDERHARTCAELAPVTKSVGLSLGDRACLALALERQLPAVTADRVWRDIDVGVRIVVVRGAT